jgi:hypothetical protein
MRGTPTTILVSSEATFYTNCVVKLNSTSTYAELLVLLIKLHEITLTWRCTCCCIVKGILINKTPIFFLKHTILYIYGILSILSVYIIILLKSGQ